MAEVLDKSWVGWRPIGLGSGLGRGHALIDQENFGEVVERLVITVSTVTVGSDFDGAAADGRAYAEKFSGTYLHRVLKASDIMCQEAPGAFIDAILEVGGGLREFLQPSAQCGRITRRGSSAWFRSGDRLG